MKCVSVTIPNSKSHDLTIAIAELIAESYSGSQVSHQTNANIKAHMDGARSILEAQGNIYMGSPVISDTKLKLAELELYKLYKNINSWNDQWYMKVKRGLKTDLITGSRYSDYRFSTSSASTVDAVFVEFETKLQERR